jgi:iron-regulated transporter 1
VLYKLYLSHTLSTWNARTFEFSAVIFLASVFPSTLFYASFYALFRSLAAFLFSSKIGQLVDTKERLWVVRQSIVWQRVAVACSCLILVVMLRLRGIFGNGDVDGKEINGVRVQMLAWFSLCVMLACLEKLAFVGNTVAVERDWAVVVAESLHVPREELNSVMRRIDLVCKLVAPVGISLVEGWWTEGAVWVVFGQNALSVIFVRVSGEVQMGK